jgi:class 3 adenylate cyclase/tetratricopeptide (TPR) repeat protein
MRDQGPNRDREAFVDRVRELEELRAGIDGALAAQGRLFTVSGEPGVGKSRLAREAAAYAEAKGVRVLWGRCWEHGGAPPYWPWVQAVRRLTGGVEPAVLSNWLGAGAAEIAQIVPELRDQIGGLPELPNAALVEPEEVRFRLFDSVISFLRKAADGQAALLIILDDLHAADPTSLLMLIAVSQQIRTTRVTIIGTYREVEVKHLPELATLISKAEREGMVLPLRGLGEHDIGEFIERTWGVSAAGPLINLLHDRTEGNPFFLHEVLRQMAAEGRLASDASISPNQLRIPRGVSEFIKRLTQPLPEATRAVLDIASVHGREFELNVLGVASRTPREDLVERLDQAASLELLSEVRGVAGRYSFRHALIREALYDALPPAKRRTLHRAVAEALGGVKAASEPFGEIAYHYCQGASPDDADQMIDYSRKAAHAAQKQLAYKEAALHLANAIDALALRRDGNESMRAELLCELGEAQVKAGDIAEARNTCLTAAELARRLNRPETFARAVMPAYRRLNSSGVTDHGLIQLLNEALERLGDSDTPLRAQALARLGIELYWSERERSVAVCQQAVEMARRLDDPHTTIVALWGRQIAMRNPDGLDQRLADAREVIALAERAGERDFALEVRYFHIADLIESGDIAGADRRIREYLTEEAELRDSFKRGLLLQAMQAMMAGRLQECQSLAQQGLVAGQQSGRPLALNSFLIHHGAALWELGRLGEYEPQQRAFVAQNPLIVFGRCRLQLTLIQLGRLEEARSEFENLAKDEFGQLQRDWNWLPSMFVLAEVCVELGEAPHAEILYRLLTPYSSRNATVGYIYTYGSVAFALGQLSALCRRFDDAEAHFEAALAANRTIRAIVWHAHTQCELASLLLTRGVGDDRERARDLIDSARQTAEALNLVRLRKRLERVCANAEASPGSAAILDTTSGLTGGGAEIGIRSAQAARLRSGEARTLDAVAASAISQARDVSALASLDGTVTILFSDVVESTALYEKLGDLRAHDVIRVHNELFRQQIAAHRGHEVSTFGDSFMIAFSSARRALLCAIAVQRSFAAYCESHPDLPLRVRIGLHVGEVIRESTDFFGKSVILAARIAALAEGGQILVSSTLHDVAGSAGDLRFEPVGEKQLKGLAGTHRIFEIVW